MFWACSILYNYLKSIHYFFNTFSASPCLHKNIIFVKLITIYLQVPHPDHSSIFDPYIDTLTRLAYKVFVKKYKKKKRSSFRKGHKYQREKISLFATWAHQVRYIYGKQLLSYLCYSKSDGYTYPAETRRWHLIIDCLENIWHANHVVTQTVFSLHLQIAPRTCTHTHTQAH